MDITYCHHGASPSPLQQPSQPCSQHGSGGCWRKEKPSRLRAAEDRELDPSGKRLLSDCLEGFVHNSPRPCNLERGVGPRHDGGETSASPGTGASPKSLRNLLVLQMSAAVPICLLISILKTFTVYVCHQGKLLSTTQLYYWKSSSGICAILNIAFPGPALWLSKSSFQLPTSPPAN